MLAFWLIDSYYLCLEKAYRELYDKVRKLDENAVDFSMNYKDYVDPTKLYPKCAFSITEIGFYLALLAVCLGVVYATGLF